MPKIIIDTREKQPYSFQNSRRSALPAGDYSIEGLEETVAIERKSLEDWIKTILYAKKRFRAELRTLQSYQFAAVVIEASLSDISAGNYRSEIDPTALFSLTTAIISEYHPIHFMFAGDRPHARLLTEQILMRRTS